MAGFHTWHNRACFCLVLNLVSTSVMRALKSLIFVDSYISHGARTVFQLPQWCFDQLAVVHKRRKDRKKVDIWYIAMPWAVSKYSKHLLFHSSHHYICLQTLTLGSQVDAAVINRASHYCELGSILGSYVGCDWLIWIWLQGLFSLLSGFLPPQKWTFPPKSVSWSVLFMSLSGSGHWETTPNVEVAFTELLNGSMDIRRTLSEFPADFWACWWNFVTKYKTKSKENDKVTRANYS